MAFRDMPFRFCDLPSEIRNVIFEFCLVSPAPIEPLQHQSESRLAVGLLGTNKAIWREAHTVFYTQNRFDFRCYEYDQIRRFIQQIGMHNASHIRHICIVSIQDF